MLSQQLWHFALMCLRNGNCDSVILPIHRLSKTLPYNVAFWGGSKARASYQPLRGSPGMAQPLGPACNVRGEAGKASAQEQRWGGQAEWCCPPAHHLLKHPPEKAPRVWFQWSTRVTSSGQLFYSDISNGAKPGNFPISSREATQQDSVKVDLKGNFKGFLAHSPV